jgi:hypothetical protein
MYQKFKEIVCKIWSINSLSIDYIDYFYLFALERRPKASTWHSPSWSGQADQDVFQQVALVSFWVCQAMGKSSHLFADPAIFTSARKE